MHGILITFTTSIPAAELAEPFAEFAHGLKEIDGLVSKAWLQESESVVGGFYLFRDTESVDAYLASAMVAELQATAGFSDFQVRKFGVLDELSAMTGIRADALA